MNVKTEQLTLQHILSVRCPMCRAKPKEHCVLSTGHPCVKTHHARTLAAATVPPPERLVQRALRTLKQGTSRGFRVLFQHKWGRAHKSDSEIQFLFQKCVFRLRFDGRPEG